MRTTFLFVFITAALIGAPNLLMSDAMWCDGLPTCRDSDDFRAMENTFLIVPGGLILAGITTFVLAAHSEHRQAAAVIGLIVGGLLTIMLMYDASRIISILLSGATPRVNDPSPSSLSAGEAAQMWLATLAVPLLCSAAMLWRSIALIVHYRRISKST